MIEESSFIPAHAPEVWARAITPEGINDELRPVLRMTIPRPLRGTAVEGVETGQKLGRSWILLFGLLPVDYDDIGLDELEPGRRFLERSTMFTMRAWEHERIIEPEGQGSRVTDRLDFELRKPLAVVPGSDRVAAAAIRKLFRHRHRRLKRHFAQSRVL